MKKYTLGALVVLAVLVLGRWLLHGSKIRMPPQVAPASEKPSKPAAVPASEKPAPQSTPVAPHAPGQEIPNAQQIKWQEMMRQLDQTPMDLFGIVIDEKSQPVPGATVRISWNPLQGDTEVVLLTTGLDGKFAFTGRKGRYVNVDVSKEGYDVVLGGRAQLPFNFAAPPGEKGYRSNPNQPEVFRLRKKGGNPALVYKDLTFVLPVNGTLKIPLPGGTTAGSGELEFNLTKSNKQRPFAWTAKAKIQGGGFIKAEGQFPFEAPEEGYQEELTWSFPLNEQGRQRHTDFEETYFVAFGSPRKYGRIKLWPKADTEKLLVEYYFDPNGGRNLEPVSPPSHPMPAPNTLDP
jgi:hypothetical protein